MLIRKIICHRICHTFFTLCTLLAPLTGLAWNHVGHRLIADIAYRHLTPKAKRKVQHLLTPFAKVYPSMNTFQTLSTWPDLIARRGVTAYGSWHYVNFPLYSNFSVYRRHPIERHNVMWAIHQSQQAIKSSRTNRYLRTQFLAFLIHTVGDIHQPLHCINRFSPQTPTGDRGGNDYPINQPTAKNLHQLWDRGLGLFDKLTLQAVEKKIETDYPPASLAKPLRKTDPKSWAQESYQIAKQFAYGIPWDGKPSPTYLKKGQKIVEERLMLAGLRLAQILNQVLA